MFIPTLDPWFDVTISLLVPVTIILHVIQGRKLCAYVKNITRYSGKETGTMQLFYIQKY